MSFERALMALVVTTISLVGCTGARKKVLELKEVASFKAVEATDAATPRLTISGLAMHSALAVDSIRTEIHGDALDVTVLLALARSGMSGSFSHELAIAPSVNQVRFGRDHAVIWRRDNRAR